MLPLLVLILLVVGGWLGLRMATNPERIRRLAEAHLNRYVSGRVNVGSASFDWSGKIHLYEVLIESPESSTTSPPAQGRDQCVLRCPDIELTHDLWAILSGGLDIQSVVVQRPELNIVRDQETGQTNLRDLLLPQTEHDDADAFKLPGVQLRGTRLSVYDRGEGGDRLVDQLDLDIRANANSTDPLLYTLGWRSLQTNDSGYSQLDLRTGELRNMEGGLPWMSIEAVMFVVNTRYDAAGIWSDLLGLQGSIRAADYFLGPEASPTDNRFATIELKKASISIPVSDAEQSLPAHQRYLRFDNVSGSLRVTENEMNMDFVGTFHGSPCSVSVTFRGGVGQISAIDDVDVEANFAMTNFEWPVNTVHPTPASRFIARFPELAEFYHYYQPRGVADLSLSVQRTAGKEAPIEVVQALLQPIDMDACYLNFPYVMNDLSGTIEYTPDYISIYDLTGHVNEGEVELTAYMRDTSNRSAIDVWIHSNHLAIDNDIKMALKPRYREVIDRFSPVGHVNLDVHMHRPHTDNHRLPAHWETQADIDFLDARLTYAGFPYPLEHVSGLLTVNDESAVIENLQGRHEEARIAVDGGLQFHGKQVTNLNIDVAADQVPIDEALLTALPARLEAELRPFQPAGRCNASVTLGWDETSQDVVPEATVFLEHARAKHADVPVPIDDINGTMMYTPERISLTGVTGRYQHALIRADGFVGCRSQAVSQVQIGLEHLDVTDQFIEYLPDNIRALLGEYRVRGLIDGSLAWRADGAPGGPTSRISLNADLDKVTFAHDRLPQPLHDVEGHVAWRDNELTLHGARGFFGEAAVLLELTLQDLPAGPAGMLSAHIIDLPLDQQLYDLLPDELKPTWDTLNPEGSIDLSLERVRFEPLHESLRPKSAGSAEPVARGATGSNDGASTTQTVASTVADAPAQPAYLWRVQAGTLALDDVTFESPSGLQKLAGTLSLGGHLVDRDGGFNLSGRLSLGELRYLNRKATNLRGEWSLVRAADGRGRFSLKQCDANLYGGSLMVDGISLEFSPQRSAYFVKATTRGVRLNPFINGEHEAGEGGHLGTTEVDGLLDAQIALTGELGDIQTRRGMGGFELYNARIYQLPVVLAILNYIDFTTPANREAFDFAKANFSLTGHRMHLEDILLKGSLTFAGRGDYLTADSHIDLQLEPKSREAWKIPVLTRVVDSTTRRLVSLRVSGPIHQPTVSPQSLPDVNSTLRDIFKFKQREERLSSRP